MSWRSDGFVLLEAVLALAIVSLFAVALLATVGGQVRTSEQAGVLLVASALAEDRQMALELLDREAFLDLPDSLAAGVFAEPFTDFRWQATVAPVEDEYDLFAAEVTVAGFGHAYTRRTLVHRSGTVVGQAPEAGR
ncbi:MAG: type II secretion system protein [Gemmatimonadota bacterium]